MHRKKNMTTYGPYSPIRQADNFYYAAGQVGVDGETKIASSDITGQTHQACQNLKRVLAGVKLKLDHIVKTTVYLKSMDDFAAMNQVYVTYFNEPRPARACIAVTELPRVGSGTDLLVEIEAVAYKKGDTSE